MATSTVLKQKRRVSFDLEHNTIHVLPTDKQVKEYADKLRREAYQNRTLNQELLDDSIISEIAEFCTCTSRQNNNMDNSLCLKSCLKTPPPMTYSKTSTKKSKKKARRHSRASSRRFENETQGMITVF
ncbi:unnamed protein product [Cunninghamella blakesleeana]